METHVKSMLCQGLQALVYEEDHYSQSHVTDSTFSLAGNESDSPVEGDTN